MLQQQMNKLISETEEKESEHLRTLTALGESHQKHLEKQSALLNEQMQQRLSDEKVRIYIRLITSLII